MKEMIKLQKDIEKTVQEKNEQFEEPVAAFLTFTTQEGYERALNHMGVERDIWGYPQFRKNMKKDNKVGDLESNNNDTELGFTLFGEE